MTAVIHAEIGQHVQMVAVDIAQARAVVLGEILAVDIDAAAGYIVLVVVDKTAVRHRDLHVAQPDQREKHLVGQISDVNLAGLYGRTGLFLHDMFGGDTRENFIGERPFGNLLHGAAQQPEPYTVVAGDAQVDRRLEEQRTAFGVLNRITPIREVGIASVEHDLPRDVDVFLHVAGPEGCRKGEVLFRGGRGIHAERLGDTYGRFGRAAELILIEERNHRDAPFRRAVLPGVECEFSVGEGQVFDPCPAFLVPVADREVDARIDGRFNGDFVVCCRGGNRQGFGFEDGYTTRPGICERMNESLASPESVVAVMTAVRFSVIEVFSE